MHVLLGGNPGNRGLVHFHRLGNVRQDQRLHGFFALIEEPLLVFNDAGGHFQQGFIPALQALDKPFRFLQLVAQVGVIGTAVSPADQ